MPATFSADLELARQCAAGDPAAWDRFVREYRPVLYRAADALDRYGGARELADSLYADLFGIKDANGERLSLFRYFQGRSSLATWLRAVLAQRFVDRLRAGRRLEPLREGAEESGTITAEHVRGAASAEPDPERPRYVASIRGALSAAVGRLPDTDRLRLACYYVHDLTLAETGRVLKEHEATVSRKLSRTRRAIRDEVERTLREENGFTEAQIAECFASMTADPGPLDLEALFDASRQQPRERSL
jgi:RNA polymerase sigma-70 factor (ECF subfamily)